MSYGVAVASILGVVIIVTLVGAGSAVGGGVTRNPWFGFRTPATMRSDAAWRAAQRAGGTRRILVLPVYLAALVVTVITTTNGSFPQGSVPIVSFFAASRASSPLHGAFTQLQLPHVPCKPRSRGRRAPGPHRLRPTTRRLRDRSSRRQPMP
ncbi:SdpI family protein [Curtobacterium sp. ISL-83]|uniref:SdpI family protein n=1 Tax=Curtobacterium sp. ISL-83 TaxID=2819145 RepID=UPI0035ABFF9B